MLQHWLIDLIGHVSGLSDAQLREIEKSLPATKALIDLLNRAQPMIEQAQSLYAEAEPLIDQAKKEWQTVGPAAQILIDVPRLPRMPQTFSRGRLDQTNHFGRAGLGGLCLAAACVPEKPLAPVPQRVDHQSKRRRGLASAWIEEVVSGARKAPVLKHAPKTPLGEMGLHHAFRHIGQARSGERRIHHLACGVKGVLTLDAHSQLATAFLGIPRRTARSPLRTPASYC
jgi:hypothetical protein